MHLFACLMYLFRGCKIGWERHGLHVGFSQDCAGAKAPGLA